ncbi:MAG: CHAT domain-containing protein [Cyanobacteriota bacterium]|nr:CHAT domain-containing protein [Cyanobacteriota bacterium]
MFRVHEEWVNGALFSSDSQQILTASNDNTARLWDRQGNLLAVLQGHDGEVNSAVLSADGRQILTASDDGTARLWDMSDAISIQANQSAALQNFQEEVSKRNAQLVILQEYVNRVYGGIFSPNGQQILTTSWDNTAQLWDRQGHLLAVLQGHEDEITSAIFSPDGQKILTAGKDDKTARLWDNNGYLLHILEGHTGAVMSAIFSPDGQKILTAGNDGTARLWDAQGNTLAILQRHTGWIDAMFSPTGQRILTTGMEQIPQLWDNQGNLLATLYGHEKNALSLGFGIAAFSPDDRQILTSNFDAPRLWDRQGNLSTVLRGNREGISTAIFSPDSQQILTLGWDNTARLWDNQGNLLADWPIGYYLTGSAAFSPDSKLLVLADNNNTAQLWDNQGHLTILRGHESWITSVVFSPDSQKILTASSDGTARLWDRQGNLLAVLRGHEGGVSSATFSPDSQQILTLGWDNTVRLWDVSTAIAIQAEQMAALQTSQATVSDQNAPQAEAALQAAIQLNQQETIESRQQALQKLEEALNLYRADNNSAKAAHVLRLIGNINADLGQFQTALDVYNQALPLSQQVGAKAEEAAILNSLGQLYSELADLKTALDYYDRALPLLYQLNDKGGAANTFNNIGTIQSATKEWGNALDSYTKALIISRPAGDLTAEATALSGIGSTYIASEDWATALNAYNQALIISRHLKDKIKETTILNQMGKIHAALGDNSTALENYTQALALSRQLGYKTEEANILYNQAILNRQQNNLTAAKTGIETAIEIVEDLRTQIGTQELRQSYFATVQSYYEFYIDLLMQLHPQNPSQGYDALALHISERARARSLLEQLTEAGLDLKADLDPTLKAEEQRLTQALNAAEQKRLELIDSSASNAELAAAIAERDDILERLQSLEARIRSANPAYANLQYPDPLTLDGIQTQILDDDTLLLQYALGEDRSYLFLVGKTTLKTYELPPKAEIEAAVEEYRQLLLSPNFTDLSQGQNLSQMLLGQIAGELQGQRLVIVGNGKLQLLPFAALPVPVSSASTALKSQTPSSPSPFSQLWEKGSQTNSSKSLAHSGERDLGRGQNSQTTLPLLANHEIITLPSATSLAVQREQWQNRQQAPRTVAVIADPVFKPSDPRLGENATATVSGDLSQVDSLIRNSCGDFDRLPNTATEAEQILALVPDAQEFSAMGFDANYNTATNSNLGQYQIVHLATHGCIQDNPLLSNLALSFFNADGQRAETSLLKLQDIYNLELNADLVVLSACQTGTGKEVQGEGVVGLTRGFMYAGARRVAVSLWSVNDRATSVLMSDYYRQMLEGGLDPSAALQQAQLAMWQSGSYSAPYYWAAFTLQGDW